MAAKKNLKIFALIPARQGSKGLPGKNMRLLKGRPLVDYTISEALKVLPPEEIFLSSDSQETLDFAKTRKIKPLLRPEKYSNDTATSSDVILHFIDSMKAYTEDYIILYLQPSSPLRRAHHIKSALDLFLQAKEDCVLSVSESRENPFKAFFLNDEKLVPVIDQKNKIEARQLLPKTYYPNGAIYIVQKSTFLKGNEIPIKDVRGFFMPKRESVDIDYDIDLKLAECILESQYDI